MSTRVEVSADRGLLRAMERWPAMMKDWASKRGQRMPHAAHEGLLTLLQICDEENLSPGERTMLLRAAVGAPMLVAGDRVLVMDVDGAAPLDLVGLTLEVERMDPAAEEYVILLRRRIAHNPAASAFWLETSPENTERVRLLVGNVELESCARTMSPVTTEAG